MNSTNSSTVGNEHFRAWLKKLDPVSRVRKMSAIAKTQSSAGLRGSLIKASLAQLSQKCRVMLIRLTQDEVNYYTRKKSIKRPQTFDNHVKDKHLGVKDPKISKLSIAHNPQYESLERCTGTKPLTLTNSGDCSDSFSCHTRNLPINVEKVKKTNNRLKQKYQELFGDDLDDLPLTKNTSDHLSPQRHSKPAKKRIKNYFSTVYVNIYNSSLDISDKKNDTIVESKNCSENNCLPIKNSASKKLKIDVSIPENKSKPDLNNLDVLPHQREVQYHKSSKRKSRKPSNTSKRLNCSHVHKSKASKPKGKSVSNINVNLGEDSNKKLWSILGMESPTDRSESIIRSHPFLSNANINKEPEVVNINGGLDKDNQILEPIKLIQDSNGIVKLFISSENVQEDCVLKQKDDKRSNQSIKEGQAVQLSVPSENEAVPNCLQTSSNELETHEESNKEILPDGHEDIRESLANENTVSLEAEPFCKIAMTFSLAGFPPVEDDYSLNMLNLSANPEDDNDNKINVQCGVNKKKYYKNEDSLKKPQAIDTIVNLEEDDSNKNENHVPTRAIETSNNSKSDHANNELSKIGTIRVKNIGLLMNPELSQHMNSSENVIESSVCPENSKVHLSNSNDENDCSQLNEENQFKEIEDRFILTYKHYFDHFVEARIPTLGELLLLVIADQIRKEERIKIAEQLSSDDLINDDKQRAEKEYNDMIKSRGIEFSPLYESIFKRFDEKSKQTLFLSLFFRLLKHAEQIDPAYKNYVIKGRDVIKCMLSKRQQIDSEVLELLNSSAEVFQRQFETINYLVIKCADSLKIPNSSVYNSTHINSPQNSSFSSLTAVGRPNQITAKPISYLLPTRNVLPITIQGKETLSQTKFPMQISNKYLASFSTANIPDVTITPTQSKKNMMYRNSSEKMYLQSSVQKTSTQLNMAPSSIGSSSAVLAQHTTNTSSSNLQTVYKTNTCQDDCPTRAIPLRANHVVKKDNFGTIYNKTIISNQPTRSVVMPAVTSLNSSVVGFNSTPLNYAKDSNQDILQELQVAGNSSNSGIYHTSGIAINTGDVKSSSRDGNNFVLRELLNTQTLLPSSSHCHPFEKRMLISGKMKMMFENSNFTT